MIISVKFARIEPTSSLRRFWYDLSRASLLCGNDRCCDDMVFAAQAETKTYANIFLVLTSQIHTYMNSKHPTFAALPCAVLLICGEFFCD